MSTVADWFSKYKTRWPRWHFTYSPPGQKGPRYPGWSDPQNAITDLEEGREFFTLHPTFGIGVLLGPSGLVTLDVDVVSITREVLHEQGIGLDAIEAPRIIGNPSKFRLVFAAPPGELPHRTLSWPQKEDPRKSFAVFELRAGCVSDMLPPSMHPDTGTPYRWALPPRAGFPPLPARLLALWQSWETAESAMKRLCPHYVPRPEPKPRTVPRAPLDGPSVIAAFNRVYDATQLLEEHGYVKRGKRFASPGTSHAPGLVLLDSGKVYCHHQGDPLNTGRALDPFDLHVHLDHRGDVRAAVKAAAEALGIGMQR